jgi:ParB-like chromosome segregation protein Spo0J
MSSIKTKNVKISDIKINPNNPRLIKDEKFNKLVHSIKEFPEMLAIRPIVVNSEMVVIGGNMRLKACKDAGLKEVPIIIADNLTEEQQKEFVIKDNVGFGDWDWQIIAEEWGTESLEDWGLDIPNFANDELLEEFDTKASDINLTPKPTDDDYSTFEMVMLHQNKLLLLETLNKIKNNFLFEKQEDSLMELVRQYNK